MSVASAIVPLFRTLWTSRFTDSCVVSRTTGDGAFNDSTGVYAAPTVTQVYSGPCLARWAGGRRDDFGEQQTVRTTVDVYVPHSVAPNIGDRVVVTCGDAELNGRTLTVRTINTDSYLTRRHLQCEMETP